MNEQVIDIITYALIIGAVSGFMYLMKKMASKKVEVNEEGKFHLKFPLLYGIFGAIGVIFGLCWIIVPFGLYYTETEQLDTSLFIMCIIGAICFISGGVYLLFYYKNHSAIFDKENIIATTIYGKSTTIKWKDIEDIKFSALLGMIIIKSHDKKAKLHQHLVGLITFVEEMEAQTDYTARELKIPVGSSKEKKKVNV